MKNKRIDMVVQLAQEMSESLEEQADEIDVVMNHVNADRMNDWEIDFTESILFQSERGILLTETQMSKLRDIETKLEFK